MKNITGNEAVGKSLGLKLRQNMSTSFFVPGPGTYHALGDKMLKKAPTWRIGSSKRDDVERARLR